MESVLRPAQPGLQGEKSLRAGFRRQSPLRSRLYATSPGGDGGASAALGGFSSQGNGGLAEDWHEGLRRWIEPGEDLVRFTYDYRFNPGGGTGGRTTPSTSYYRSYEQLAKQ